MRAPRPKTHTLESTEVLSQRNSAQMGTNQCADFVAKFGTESSAERGGPQVPPPHPSTGELRRGCQESPPARNVQIHCG